MSEARRDSYPDDQEQHRLTEELRGVQAYHFLGHNQALLEDALQRQILSATQASLHGLRFVDIYTRETSVKVPHDRALSVLATPDGTQLRPSEPTPHFFVYFSTVEGRQEVQPATTFVNWIERVDAR